MRELVQAIPDGVALLALEPEELGTKLIFILREYRKNNPTQLLHRQIVSSDQLFRNNDTPDSVYPQQMRPDIELAISEAWAWLEVQGLVVPAPGMNGDSGWRVLSRRAARFKDEQEFTRYEVARRLPREALHSRLRDRVWLAFVRGELDTAAFQAMKAVEVAVRRASGISGDLVGVKLMRAAFKPESGPLADLSAEIGEQEARMHLFAGAVGSFKNPHSHRDVDLTNPVEAIEIVMFANHLLRVVDARADARASVD